jgi:hypothetical protein
MESLLMMYNNREQIKPNGFRWLLAFLAITLIQTLGINARAADNTTPGALRLKATMECIGLQASFTGDANSNNTAVVTFKESAGSTWKMAYTPFIDRRATINNNSNAHSNEARVSIVGLKANTAYTVAVTWGDADGVVGSSSTTGTVTTVARTPLTGGSSIWVDASAAGGGNGSQGSPYNTLASAISAASAGTTIKIMPGSYPALTITKAGTLGAWIKFEAQSTGVTIGGGTDSITINNSSYLWFQGITLPASSQSGFWLNTCNHIMIDSCIFTNIGTGGSYGHAGVHITANATDIYVLDSDFRTVTADSAYPDGSIFGVYFEGGNIGGGHIISGNRANAIFRDWNGGGGNGWGDGPVCDSDLCHNTINGTLDDKIECEGENRNVRIFDNRLSGGGNALLATAGTQMGPLYVFRNVMWTTNGTAGVKLGNTSPGPAFFFHNTFNVVGSGASPDGFSDLGGETKSELHHFRNNVVKVARYGIYRGGRSNTYDYNIYKSTVNNWIADEYNTSGSYQHIAALRSATGQEIHGIEADPMLNSDNTLATNSPAIDAGVVLPNFNDAGSAWPYAGNGPDMGAFESSSGTSSGVPTAPASLIVTPQ